MPRTRKTGPRFEQGDKVEYQGRVVEIGSWPYDNQGMCYCFYYAPDGGMVTLTLHCGEFPDVVDEQEAALLGVDTKGEPIGEVADFTLVKRAGRRPASTAGKVPDGTE